MIQELVDNNYIFVPKFYSAAKNIDQFFGDIGLAAESLEPRFFSPAG